MPRLHTPVADRATALRLPTHRQLGLHTEILRPADLELEPLFSHVRDAAVVADLDTCRIALWNPAAERIFGWSAAEAVGESLEVLLAPAVLDLHKAGMFVERPVEVPAATRRGDEIRVELSFVALHYPAAPGRYVLALLRELAHSSERASVRARVVQARAERVRRDLESLATRESIETRMLQLNFERVNLVPIVSREVARLRERGLPHKLNVAVPQGLTATADAARIEQLVETLLEHAVARCPRGCWIDVDLRRPLVGIARLEVHDFGRALSEEQRRELEGGGHANPRLALARAIVEVHGGTLAFEFPADGGVRVVATLPTHPGRVTRGA